MLILQSIKVHLQKWVWLLNFTTCWNVSQCHYAGIFCRKDTRLQGELAANIFPVGIPSLLSPGTRNFSSASRLRLRAAFCIYWPALKFFQSSVRKKPSSWRKMSVVWGMAACACLSMVAGRKMKLITCVTLSPTETQLWQTDARHVNSLYHIEPWVWVLSERFYNSYNLK